MFDGNLSLSRQNACSDCYQAKAASALITMAY
jgi:cytochrome c peroxidase